jgi:hypothetical protein
MLWNKTPITHMDENDFVWLHQAFTEAFADVSNPSAKQMFSTKALDGEIYTRLRAMIPSSGLRADSPLRYLFASRRRYLDLRFDQLKQHDKEKVAAMFNVIKRGRLEEIQDTDACIHNLENLLAGMRSSVNQMTDAAIRSEEVRDNIEKLDEFLGNA